MLPAVSLNLDDGDQFSAGGPRSCSDQRRFHPDAPEIQEGRPGNACRQHHDRGTTNHGLTRAPPVHALRAVDDAVTLARALRPAMDATNSCRHNPDATAGAGWWLDES